MGKELTRITPFRMIGNIYFVGTKEASCHLIDTGDGLILIDTGYEECAEIVVESMNTLGFNISDVKYILHSHGHYDHTDATAAILSLVPDAKTFLSFKDLKYIRGFTPDFDIKDGDVIKLGNTEIKCLFTPGHTEGSVSFFLDVTEDGEIYRAAMFGGSGVNQLRRDYMNRRDVPYLCRGLFFDSIERLLGERVDVMIGNHTWQNKTLQKYEKMATAEKNPFIKPNEWGVYLRSLRASLERVMRGESREKFITYAHRGASEYYPENTMTSFERGLEIGANGIETDVQVTKDGVLVLFHDKTLERVTGAIGSVCDYTYAQLCELSVKHGDMSDKIPTLEEFLARFADMELTFAIEIKSDGIEHRVADMLLRDNIYKKCIVTSFDINHIKNVKAYAPNVRVGYLTSDTSDAVISELVSFGADEICPRGRELTAETVDKCHRVGFSVRAWGIANEEIMKQVYDAGADGMTVNFPDKLIDYIASVTPAAEEQV